jgi:hypothetical protein
MILEINDTKTVEELRKEFSEYYSFLSLEFYDRPHELQEATPVRHQYRHSRTIGQIRGVHEPGLVEISPLRKTGEVEQSFSKQHGLYVQILRHHGDTWVQTAGTDALTLQEQNEIGRRACENLRHRTGSAVENDKYL